MRITVSSINGKHIVTVNRDVWEFDDIGEAMKFVWLNNGRLKLDGREVYRLSDGRYRFKSIK